MFGNFITSKTTTVVLIKSKKIEVHIINNLSKLKG